MHQNNSKWGFFLKVTNVLFERCKRWIWHASAVLTLSLGVCLRTRVSSTTDYPPCSLNSSTQQFCVVDTTVSTRKFFFHHVQRTEVQSISSYRCCYLVVDLLTIANKCRKGTKGARPKRNEGCQVILWRTYGNCSTSVVDSIQVIDVDRTLILRSSSTVENKKRWCDRFNEILHEQTLSLVLGRCLYTNHV